jgi:hypothetical protein
MQVLPGTSESPPSFVFCLSYVVISFDLNKGATASFLQAFVPHSDQLTDPIR